MSTEKPKRSFLSIVSLLGVLLVVSACLGGVREEENKKIETLLHTKNDRRMMRMLADSLDLRASDYEDLLVQSYTDHRTAIFLRKIHLLHDEMDSIQSAVNSLRPSKSQHNSPNGLELQKLVYNMHDAWKNLPRKKDKKDILKFFTPRYSVQRLSIHHDNKAELKNYTKKEFDQYLGQVISRKKQTIQFGNVSFLDIEVKDDSLFNVVYKCTMRRYGMDRLVSTSSLLVTLTGRKHNKQWKIGRYSWVNISH